MKFIFHHLGLSVFYEEKQHFFALCNVFFMEKEPKCVLFFMKFIFHLYGCYFSFLISKSIKTHLHAIYLIFYEHVKNPC